MDTELYQEKMNPVHRGMLCRMLNVKDLPETLLVRYHQVKMLVDRIDAPLAPGDLALIIISTSTEPEIATELAETEEMATEQFSAADDEVIEEAVEPQEKILNSPVVDPEVTEMIWSPGMPVRVLVGDEIKQGKIVGISPPDEDNEQTRLTVDFEDGETETFAEEEVEAV